jgi:hypothetical protein
VQVGKIPKAADTGQIARSQKWSKRDKMEFLRLLMRWGLPLVRFTFEVNVLPLCNMLKCCLCM